VSTEPEPTARVPRTLLLVGLGVVVAVAVLLRFLTTSDLWLDEALTVNIAKLPLGDLHEALKHDGAPPLYYLLLHGWIRLFGSSDLAVRSLSGVLGVAMLPLAYLAALRVGVSARLAPAARRWLAWATLLVVAASPYAIRYSTEARMYVLAMDLVFVGYLALWWALDRPTVWRLGAVSLVTVALMLTQYWALFLLVVVGVIELARAIWAPRPERGTARRIVGALVVGGVLFLPWLPTFLYQQQHTGTPWDARANPPIHFGLAFLDFAGGSTSEGWALLLPIVVLGLLGLFGRAVDARHVDLDLGTAPGVRWEWLVGVTTLVLGLCLSFAAGTGFQPRYAAVMWPLVALGVALGFLVFADRRVRVALLAIVVLLGFVGGVRNVVTNRTQASQVADVIAREASPGDVVAYCPDQVGPDVSRLLPSDRGLRQYTFPNLGSPHFVDWVDYAARNEAASVPRFVDRILARAGEHRVWMVWSPGYRTYNGKCEAIVDGLARRRPRNAAPVSPDTSFYEYMGLRWFAP